MIRWYFFLWMALVLLPGPVLAAAPDMTGIFPAVATPGSTVTIIGGPFEQQVQVVFGDRTLRPAGIAEKQLTFVVPQLAEGDYLLFLQAGEQHSERSLFFRVVLPAPSITSLTPSKIEACTTGEQRQVVLQGRDLHRGVQVLLDGVALAAGQSGNTLTFTLPEMTPGLHQVQVINPDGKRSVPVSLLVDALPEIQSVSRGEENVNYYELLVSGKNFSYNSTLVVNGRPITPFYPGSLQVDSITFRNCKTLIYKRYPASSQPTQINLQIINPDGKESAVYTLSAP
ncbi:MAG: IPT/TIG domain-containing protein [Pedobacter sp.]